MNDNIVAVYSGTGYCLEVIDIGYDFDTILIFWEHRLEGKKKRKRKIYIEGERGYIIFYNRRHYLDEFIKTGI